MRKWFVASWIVVFLAGVVPVSIVLAATQSPPPAGSATGSGQGLEISPPVIELSANPGQTVTATIRVRNVASGELIAKGRTDDFGAGSDEDGRPKLLLEESGESRYSLRHWVQGVPDLRLASQELKTATVSIRVPTNAEPGGHFGVIRFTAVPPNLEGTGVALSASVGTLVLLRVAGTVVDKVTLAELATGRMDETQKQAFKKTGFFEHGPVDFVVRLKNEGTVHEKVQGKIEVTNLFGKKVGEVAVNEKGGNVLPDSVRRFEQRLNKKALFGYYTAKLHMTYVGGNKKLDGKVGFWVIPWKLLFLVILALAMLFYGLRIGIKRYNQHIIERARR